LSTDGALEVLEHERAKEIYLLQYGESWFRRLSEEVAIVVEVVPQAVYFIRARSFKNNFSSQICSDIGSDTGIYYAAGRAFHNFPAVAS
jgi:hypothetical protein